MHLYNVIETLILNVVWDDVIRTTTVHEVLKDFHRIRSEGFRDLLRVRSVYDT